MTAAAEIAALLKRTFAMYRLYGVDHETSADAEANLFRRLVEHLDHDDEDLCFRFEATQLLVGDAVVLTDDRPEESITRPPFVDGVASLGLHRGIEPDELSRLLGHWFAAVASTLDAEHTLGTILWEMEAAHISVQFQPGLAEHGVTDGEQSRSTRASQLMEEVMAAQRKSMPSPGAVRVDRASLGVFGEVPAFRELDGEALAKRADAEGSRVEGLSEVDTKALRSGLTMSTRGVGQRALLALWRCMEVATQSERARLVELVTDAVVRLVAERRTAEVCRALVRVLEFGRDAAPIADFLRCLEAPDVTRALVELVSDPDRRSDALTLLGYTPRERAEVLLDPIVEAPRDVRSLLIGTLANKAPAPETLAGWIVARDETATEVVLALAERLSPEHRDMAVRGAIIHDHARVRTLGLKAIRTETASSFGTHLIGALEDDDPGVRRAALDTLIRAKDPLAAQALARQLDDTSTSVEERITCVRALGAVGGPIACAALRRTFERASDQKITIAAALALGQARDETAVALLREPARRRFFDKKLRAACREALRRIEGSDDA